MRLGPIRLRGERPRDRAQVAALLRRAFRGPGEAELVARLRRCRASVAALVAVRVRGPVVGHVMFSRLGVRRGPAALASVALAPVAVRASERRRGVAARLIVAGLGLCRMRGAQLAVVLGDPDYYRRFGFSAALGRHLDCVYAGPALMALELAPGALNRGRWKVSYARPFAALG